MALPESLQVKRIAALRRRLAGELVREDLSLPHLHWWPAWARETFLKPNKTHNELLPLFKFLWKNGLTPDQAGAYTLWWEMHVPDLAHVSAARLDNVATMVRDAQLPLKSEARWRLESVYVHRVGLTRDENVANERSHPRTYGDWLHFIHNFPGYV